ncbi:MAG: O-antigen ligase family protein [Elusimicrobiota bacterium]
MTPLLILEGGLWLAVLGTSLAWTDALLAEYVLPKLLLLSLAVLVCAVGTALSRRSGPRFVRPTALDPPLLCVGAALLLSTAFSQDRLLSVLGHYNSHVLGVWPLLLCAAVYYSTAWRAGVGGVKRVLRVCLVAGAVVGAYALLQAAGLEVFPRVAKLPQGRAISTIGGPVFLGAYLAVLLPLALHWFLSGGRERVFGGVCVALMAGGLWATASRGSWLGAAAGCVAYGALRHGFRQPRWSGKEWLFAACLVAVLGGLAVLGLSTRDIRWHEAPRLEIWKAAVQTFQGAPLLGSGPDTFELGFRRFRTDQFIRWVNVLVFQIHAHNDILQALATTGIVGFSCWLFLLVGLVRAALRGLRASEGRLLAAALSAGLLSLFVHMKFNPAGIGAIVVAAVFAGHLCRPTGEGASPQPAFWLVGAVLALGILSVSLASRMVWADRQMKRGLAHQKVGNEGVAYAYFKSAVRLNRCELEYRRQIVNHLIEWAYGGPGGEVRAELFDVAAGHAATAMDCHPNDMYAHYILGVSLLMQAQAGRSERLEPAENALDEALQRDSLYLPLIEARLRAARLRGDQALAERLSSRVEYVESLMRPE